MSTTRALAALAESGGDGLWRTNPVLCVDRLVQDWASTDIGRLTVPGRIRVLLTSLSESGIRVPPCQVARWESECGFPAGSLPRPETPPAPGVIGLAVDGTGYVVPLAPALTGGEWRIERSLPFSPEQVQDGLVALLAVSGVELSGAVPERLAFAFDNPLGRRACGDSMTLAAVLAVLAKLAGPQKALLRSVVALVEMRPGGQLVPVAEIEQKFAAAVRERGRLSLAVVANEEGIDRSKVDELWVVGSTVELARRLGAAGLLAPLLVARGQLDRREVARALERLKRLVVHEHHYQDAVDLGQRVRTCGLGEAVEPGTRIELAHFHAEACRQQGRFGEATAVSKDVYETVRDRGEFGCDDDDADAAAGYGASLFSHHRFAAVVELLRPYADAVNRDTRRFRPLTRVKVWNTLGRALAASGQLGWEELFRASLRIHEHFQDDDNTHRTTHYFAHALLRCNQIAEVRKVLAQSSGGADSPWRAFLQADLARREACVWTSPALEDRIARGDHLYAVWLYVQATARQPSEQAERRFELAVQLLRTQAADAPGNICHLFASLLELASAARCGCQRRWTDSLTAAGSFLSAADEHIRRHYEPRLKAFETTPDQAAVERVLDIVPYF